MYVWYESIWCILMLIRISWFDRNILQICQVSTYIQFHMPISPSKEFLKNNLRFASTQIYWISPRIYTFNHTTFEQEALLVSGFNLIFDWKSLRIILMFWKQWSLTIWILRWMWRVRLEKYTLKSNFRNSNCTVLKY